MSESILDLADLFELEEEPQNELQTKTRKTRTEKEKEASIKSNPGAEKTEPADSIHTEGSSSESGGEPGVDSRATKQPGDDRATKTNNKRNTFKEPQVNERGWNVNVIGTPKGHPNPYFEGVVAYDGFNEKQILVPFKDITSIQRQVYVDDITLENPETLAIIYRVVGSFNDVVARLTQDEFEALIAERKIKNVNYSWVSSHRDRKRAYLVNHAQFPTPEEIQAIDKHEDEVEWALMPSWKKDQMKAKNENLKDMPEEEDIPLPQNEFEEVPEDDSNRDQDIA